MRYFVGLLLLALLGGCGLGPSSQDGSGPELETPSSTPSDPDTPDPEPSSPGTPETPRDDRPPGGETNGEAGDEETCEEVRAGIDAFNAGDFEETVSRFEAAVPLAEAAAAADSTPPAEELLEAVEYYAELAPTDYPEAALRSPAFAKYKAITLGQCAGEGQNAPPSEDPGVEV